MKDIEESDFDDLAQIIIEDQSQEGAGRLRRPFALEILRQIGTALRGNPAYSWERRIELELKRVPEEEPTPADNLEDGVA